MPLIFDLDILIRSWIFAIFILIITGHYFFAAIFISTCLFNHYDEERDTENFDIFVELEAICIDFQFGTEGNHNKDAWHFDRWFEKEFAKDLDILYPDSNIEKHVARKSTKTEEVTEDVNIFVHNPFAAKKKKRYYNLEDESLYGNKLNNYEFEINSLEDFLHILDDLDYCVPVNENDNIYFETGLFYNSFYNLNILPELYLSYKDKVSIKSDKYNLLYDDFANANKLYNNIVKELYNNSNSYLNASKDYIYSINTNIAQSNFYTDEFDLNLVKNIVNLNLKIKPKNQKKSKKIILRS